MAGTAPVSLSKEALEARRVIRLDQCFKAATWWMGALGVIYLITGNYIAYWLHIRFQAPMAPLMRVLGMAYLIIALLLRRSVSEPENQIMAVDLCCLFFWMQAVIYLSAKLSSQPVNSGEWVITAVNAGFGACLFLWRTKSTEVPAGTPGSKEAKLAARELMGKLKVLVEEKKRARPLPSVASVNAQAHLASGGALGQDGAPVRKPLSEAAPHMD